MITITVKYIEIVILVLFTLISDIKTFKIKNSIILPFILIGLATNFYLDGLEGLKLSIIGIIAPIAVLFLLFVLRMLGAGDIKLFAAIGSILGMEPAMYIIIYSIISGGIISFFILLVRKNGRERLKFFFKYIKAIFFTLRPLPYENFQSKMNGSKFHFTIAIVIGTVIKGSSEFF